MRLFPCPHLLAAALMIAFSDACKEENAATEGDTGTSTGTSTDAGTDATTTEPPRSLEDQGVMGDWCDIQVPNGLNIYIGLPSDCGLAPGPEAHIHFLTNAGSTAALKAGQAWQTTGAHDEVLRAWWYPHGAGHHEVMVSGSLEVLSVSGSQARLRYEFLTDLDRFYAGEATVLMCSSEPDCS